MAGDAAARTRWLVVAAQLGDRAALDELLRSVQDALYRHLCFVLGAEDDAADALQDTLLTISRKIGTLRHPRWFRAWAFRIATRNAIRRARRGRSGPVIVGIDDAGELPAPDADAAPFDEEERAAMRAALAQAPPASRLVLRMHYEDELTHAEIAEALDLSIGTVKSRLHYGVQWLRRRLQGVES